MNVLNRNLKKQETYLIQIYDFKIKVIILII